MLDLTTSMRDYYGRVKAAYLHGNFRELQLASNSLSTNVETDLPLNELEVIQTYAWCCQSFEAHYLLRNERYAEAIIIARKILKQRDLLIQTGRISCEFQKLNYMAELYVLYILGTCKWIGVEEIRDQLFTPQEMLNCWLLNLDRVQHLREEDRQQAITHLRISGQTVLQTGLRYCSVRTHEVMLRFNRQFESCLNPALRHYISCPFPPRNCYLYWSIELAKAMYSGNMTINELEFLISNERRALYQRNDPDVDRAYGDIAFASFTQTISRRFCIDNPNNYLTLDC